jgi:hypothetical protein
VNSLRPSKWPPAARRLLSAIAPWLLTAIIAVVAWALDWRLSSLQTQIDLLRTDIHELRREVHAQR